MPPLCANLFLQDMKHVIIPAFPSFDTAPTCGLPETEEHENHKEPLKWAINPTTVSRPSFGNCSTA